MNEKYKNTATKFYNNNQHYAEKRIDLKINNEIC